MQNEVLEVPVKQSNKNLTIVLAIMGIILVVGMISAYFLYNYFRQDTPLNNETEQESPTPNQTEEEQETETTETSEESQESSGSAGSGGGSGGSESESSTPTPTITGDCQVGNICFLTPTPEDGSRAGQADLRVGTSISGEHYSFIEWNNSLIAYWRAENGTTEEINNNNGELKYYSTISPGKFGKSFEFSINESEPYGYRFGYMNINDSESLNFSESFTISAWTYMDSKGGYLFQKGKVYLFHSAGNRRWQFQISDSSDMTFTLLMDEDPTGQWHHVVGVYDSERMEPKLYVDGVLATEKYGVGLVENADQTGNARIGYQLDGKVDDILVFNRSISSEEVKGLYNALQYKTQSTFYGEGNYSYQAFAIDSLSNKYESEKRQVELSKFYQPPTIDLIYPFDQASYADNELEFIFQVNSSLATNFNCDIYINNQVKRTLQVNNRQTHKETIGVEEGVNNWRIECTDNYRNSNTSQTRTFTINKDINILINSPISQSENPINFDVDFSEGYSFIDWNNTLMAWFRAEDNAMDESGRENHCEIRNVKTSSGLFGKAFEFDGVNDYISCFDTTHLDLNFRENDPFTISLWAYKLDDRYAGKTLVDKGCGRPSYSLFYHGSGRWQVGIGDGVNSAYAYVPDYTPENKWRHIVAVYDPQNHNLSIYLDGKHGRSSPANIEGYMDTQSELRIGTNCYGGGMWNGKIDEILFFKRALTPGEIQQLYNSSKLKNNYTAEELQNYPYKIHAVNNQGTKKTNSGNVFVDTPHTLPSISLTSPLNNTRTPVRVDFTCKAKSTNQNTQLTNITFYWDYGGEFREEETKQVSSDTEVFFTKTPSESIITWNCYACDTEGNCGFSKENNTLVVGRNNYYISTTGSDTNPGTLDEPFETIQKCADITLPGDTCYIRGGTYRETVIPKNTGNEQARITFKAYNNEEVTVSGADPVTGWTQHSGEIYKANMDWDLSWSKNQIFMNKQMMLLARWPNQPSLNVMKPITEAIESGTNLTTGMTTFELYNSNLTHPSGYWENAKIHLRYSPAYWTYTGTVQSNEPGKLIFTQHQGGYGHYPDWAKFYLMDDYDALDSEGEWYYDNETQNLYLWQPGGGTPTNVEAKARDIAFDLSGKSYITLDGIDIFSAGLLTNKTSENIIIDNMDAKYVYHEMRLGSDYNYKAKSSGIVLEGKNHKLTNSHIQYSSCNGISMDGEGHEVSYSEIHDVNYMANYCGTINTVGKRVTNINISHNKLHDSGRDVLLHEGAQNMKLMYNEMYNTNVGKLTSDLGVTYANSYDYNGSEIAYNIVYDNDYTYGGIYLDYRSMNAYVHHNIIYNIGCGTIFHSPKNIKFDHNTVVNSRICGSWWTDEKPGKNFMIFRNNLLTSSIPSYSYGYFENNLISNSEEIFVDKTNYDFHLRENSPAIDYGNDLGYTHDFDGNPIIGKPDAGAYEYQGITATTQTNTLSIWTWLKSLF
jgi:hypothetical protein